MAACTLTRISALLLAVFPLGAYAADSKASLEPIQHIIVISLENHSFDNLFGFFPGADGITNAKKKAKQRDRRSKVYKSLPPVMDTSTPSPKIDARFPDNLRNKPFAIEKYVPAGEKTGGLVHRYHQQIDQIHGGRMDRFAAVSDAGALTMGYYDGSKLGLWKYAEQYTLADRFFHAAFGGSFLNHFWMICACTPRFPNAPEELVSRVNRKGELIKGGSVTEDGYAINTVFPIYTPHPPHIKNTEKLLPPQDMPTIGDRLSDKGIEWAWYAGGWDDAMEGKAHPSFQFHHQPFVYFSNYGDRTSAKSRHLKDERDFLEALKNDTLPAVAFYKPLGKFNLHPSYSDVISGDAHIVKILQAIEASPVWKNSVVIVTFDENGGYWDHVPPPKGDRWGPGVRVPTIIISPFAKKGYVDHTPYDTTSILKFIEKRFALEPLPTRKKVGDLTGALVLN